MRASSLWIQAKPDSPVGSSREPDGFRFPMVEGIPYTMLTLRMPQPLLSVSDPVHLQTLDLQMLKS
jgi:hypothetical protein